MCWPATSLAEIFLGCEIDDLHIVKCASESLYERNGVMQINKVVKALFMPCL